MEEFKSWEEMSDKEQLQSIFWDAYKDANGFRPRHIDTSAMTEDQLSTELDLLGEQIRVQEAQRAADEVQHAATFEKRVQQLIEGGAGDRATALRWIHQAEGTDGDDEFLCYTLGLKYGYFKAVASVAV